MVIQLNFIVCYKRFVLIIVNHFRPFEDTAIGPVALIVLVINTQNNSFIFPIDQISRGVTMNPTIGILRF